MTWRDSSPKISVTPITIASHSSSRTGTSIKRRRRPGPHPRRRRKSDVCDFALLCERAVDCADQVTLRHLADDLLLDLAALDDEQVRNAADAVPRRRLGIVVNVYLDHLEPAGILARQLVDEWSDGPAGRAPRGPEIDQHRFIG